MKTLRFSALDTWFFRESRPMDAIGGAELASIFPPSPRTLLGAVRSAIGDATGVDWRDFASNAAHPLRSRIGFGDDLGPLSLAGPWLCKDGERLYPAPLFLLEKTVGTTREFARLRIGTAAHTHLGRVRLPELPPDRLGYKPVERAWLSGAAYATVLRGAMPDPEAIHRASDLFTAEPRLGIARDNARRITDDGLLYQTCHLRPRSGLSVEADLVCTSDTATPTGLVRLGGEGRLAHLTGVDDPTPFPKAPQPNGATRGLILILLTAARLGTGADAWLLPRFQPAQQADGTRIWTGEIGGVGLTLHAAVIGKVLREGGWNLADQRPRPVQSLVPPGSAWYVTVTGSLESAIAALYQIQIGADQTLGRGQIACALWNLNEF